MIVNWSGLYHHLPLRMTTQYSDEYEPGDGDVTDRWHSPMSRHYAEAYYQCDVRQTAKTFILKGHRLFPKFQLVVPQNTPSTRDGSYCDIIWPWHYPKLYGTLGFHLESMPTMLFVTMKDDYAILESPETAQHIILSGTCDLPGEIQRRHNEYGDTPGSEVICLVENTGPAAGRFQVVIPVEFTSIIYDEVLDSAADIKYARKKQQAIWTAAREQAYRIWVHHCGCPVTREWQAHLQLLHQSGDLPFVEHQLMTEKQLVRFGLKSGPTGIDKIRQFHIDKAREYYPGNSTEELIEEMGWKDNYFERQRQASAN